MEVFLPDLFHTNEFGRVLGSFSMPGDVILLVGELGSGKTSLCRGFLREFTGDIDLDVPSPSYLISLQYSHKNDSSLNVFHIDPYRLSVGNVACLVDFENALKDDVLLIEWPSRLGDELTSLINAKALRVMTITYSGVGPQAVGRNIVISVGGSELERVWLESLMSGWNNLQAPDPITSRSKQVKLGHVALNPLQNTLYHQTDEEILMMGIESSCDDTAVAVVRGDGTIVAQCIASQGAVHEEWGGVVPKLAQEEHAKAISGTVDSCLLKAGITCKDLSGIAVTVGPGLGLCLLVGIGKAMELSAEFQVPLIRIHHMEAHMMVTRLPNLCSECPVFPFVTLLISGGHTMIVLTRDIGDHLILGSTIDDSVGEAFDKTARLLGITSIPGGKELEQMALTGNANNCVLPKPLSKTKDTVLRNSCDMSFAGLKTAVVMAAKNEDTCKNDLAACFQQTCADHLADRLNRALNIVVGGSDPLVTNMRHVVVAGGVAANKTVNEAVVEVANSFGLIVCAPPPVLCADNGVMVAWTGIERFKRGLAEPPPKLKGEFFAEARPRWPLGTRHSACNGKINDSAGKSFDRKARDVAANK